MSLLQNSFCYIFKREISPDFRLKKQISQVFSNFNCL